MARNRVKTPSPDESRLTVREKQVVALFADGLSYKKIGERLGIATMTVKIHLKNARRAA